MTSPLCDADYPLDSTAPVLKIVDVFIGSDEVAKSGVEAACGRTIDAPCEGQADRLGTAEFDRQEHVGVRDYLLEEVQLRGHRFE